VPSASLHSKTTSTDQAEITTTPRINTEADDGNTGYIENGKTKFYECYMMNKETYTRCL